MKAKKKNPVKTVLIITTGFGIIFLLTRANWALYTALSVGVLGIISHKICEVIDFLWMKLAKGLSYIIPNILLSVVFYVFLFPIALLAKIFGNKNALQLKGKRKTTWVEKNAPIKKVSFEKMW